MPIKVVTQTTLTEGKSTKGFADDWLDDCGVTSAGIAVQWATNGAVTVTPQQAWNAGAEAGRKDFDGVGNGSTAVQVVKTAKVMGARASVCGDWQKAKTAALGGAAVIVNVQAPLGIPERVWSKWQKGRKPGETYGHWCVLANEGGQWMYADPTMSGKGKEQYGKNISEAEADDIAHSKRLANMTPIWIVVRGKEAPVITAEAPRSDAEASKPLSGTRTHQPIVSESAKRGLEAELAVTLRQIKTTPMGAAKNALYDKMVLVIGKMCRK